MNCQFCSTKFSQKCHLYRHLRKIHNFEPIQRAKAEYSYGQCHEHFAQACHLLRHIREQHGSKEYHECEYCPIIFPTRLELVAHCQEVHNVIDQRQLDATNFEKVQTSTKGFFRVYESIPTEKEFDVDGYLMRQEDNVRALVDQILKDQSSFRLQLTLLVQMIKELEDEEREISCNSLMETIYQDGLAEEHYTKRLIT